MARLKFTKMQGLGNDFMVVDGISQKFQPRPELISRWGDRHFGIGFDQLLLIGKSSQAGCDFSYRIFNCDGTEVEQCGNGARCFAKYVFTRALTAKRTIRVAAGSNVIVLKITDSGLVEVNMGKPKLKPGEIPFIPQKGQSQGDFIEIISIGVVALPVVCVNVGNPHAVVMVDNLNDTPVASWGRSLEFCEQFPQKTNVEFVEISDREHIKVRVHERGAGETLACGTGACAAVVAGVLLQLLERRVAVSLPGGDLVINWSENGEIFMTGPAEFVFDGELTL